MSETAAQIEALLQKHRTPERDAALATGAHALFATTDLATGTDLKLIARALREVADGGEPMAMVDYGRCLWNGWGVKKSQEEALQWYRKSADSGFDFGAFITAENLYWHFKRYDEAYRYAQQAYAGGDPSGEVAYLLGLMTFGGRGCAKDPMESLRLHHESATKENPEAIFELAVYAFQGIAMPANPELGITLTTKAAELGNPRACANLAGFYASGRMGEGKDPESAVRWYKRAAKLGHSRSHAVLGIMAMTGDGMPISMEDARKHFGDAEALGFDVVELLEEIGLQRP